MNRRDSPEMLYCLNMAGNVAGVRGMEMSVLERQRMVLKWQQEEDDQAYFNELSSLAFLPTQAQDFQGLNMNSGSGPVLDGPAVLTEVLNRVIKADPGVEPGWVDSPPLAVAAAEAQGIKCINSEQKINVAAGRDDSFKKRKAEKNLPQKVDIEECGASKKSKGCEEEEESKITVQNSNSSNGNHKESNGNNNKKKNRDASGCTSKDNSKAAEVQKPDYIHVRARRGQATDSHSLAERVRREKISERMKYLQDIVPGCNKITGKAGMLDEIINYVQSLQRQVEFLSMKLAAVHPRLDFNIDELIAKEVFAACSTSLPNITDANYLQYNLVQQMNSFCEVGLNPIDMGIRRAISAPASLPNTYIDSSYFNQIWSGLPWDADLQNTMEFQYGRETPFTSQTFTGTIEASSMKMEM